MACSPGSGPTSELGSLTVPQFAPPRIGCPVESHVKRRYASMENQMHRCNLKRLRLQARDFAVVSLPCGGQRCITGFPLWVGAAGGPEGGMFSSPTKKSSVKRRVIVDGAGGVPTVQTGASCCAPTNRGGRWGVKNLESHYNATRLYKQCSEGRTVCNTPKVEWRLPFHAPASYRL